MLKCLFVVAAVVEAQLAEADSAGCYYLRFLLLMAVHTPLLWARAVQLVILAEPVQLHTTTQFMQQLEVVEAQVLQVHYLEVVGAVKVVAQWDFLVIYGQH
jgi:hypothetical protein